MTERKIALVTGGSRGIGLACAKELAKAGCDIIINDICEAEKAQPALDEIKELGANAYFYRFDVSDPVAVQENVDKMIEKGVVEIAPLAYMRGRTLDNAMIILDEAQNTTSNQMKMFITRLGFNSKMVITGDVTQIDLPNHITSGLTVATRILTNVQGIAHVQFGKYDVMRHPLVSKIIEKYEENDD